MSLLTEKQRRDILKEAKEIQTHHEQEPSRTLADQVRVLETKCRNATELSGDILACLELNRKHFLLGDEEADKIFQQILQQWQERYRLLALDAEVK